MKHVVIVGAGISGLAVAYRLQQSCPTIAITVLEENHRPGGTVWTERQNNFQVEIGPNGFLDNKPFTLNLCRSLGLENRLVAASEASGRNRYLFWNGRLEPLPRNLRSFLSTPLLSWRGKLRLLVERFAPRARIKGDESIDAFVRRRAGKEAAEVLADALVTGIYGGDPRILDLGACFPRLAAMEKDSGSVIAGFVQAARRRRAESAGRGEQGVAGRMWSFPEGLRLLIETLRERLSRPPICGVKVCRLETTSGAPLTTHHSPLTKWIVHGEGRDCWPADAVVLACPAHEQAVILTDVDRELAGRIESIAYNRLAVVALGYRRLEIPGNLDGFGYIAPQRTQRDILGVQWCSSIFPQRAPAGMVLLRAMCGGWNRPEIVSWNDDRLIQAARTELRLSMHITGEPSFHHIVRCDRAIPQYRLGHLEQVAWIEERAERYPSLFLAGNSYRGVALNDCVEQSEILAARLAAFLSSEEKAKGILLPR